MTISRWTMLEEEDMFGTARWTVLADDLRTPQGALAKLCLIKHSSLRNVLIKHFGYMCLLGGGFKYVLFAPLFGEGSHFGKYFSKGLKPPTIWNSSKQKCLNTSTMIPWSTIFNHFAAGGGVGFWRDPWSQGQFSLFWVFAVFYDFDSAFVGHYISIYFLLDVYYRCFREYGMNMNEPVYCIRYQHIMFDFRSTVLQPTKFRMYLNLHMTPLTYIRFYRRSIPK